MRQGQQHRRGRGRNNQNNGHGHGHSHGHNQRKGQNPLTRSFESNGPDVKVRGTPAHIAEKYLQLARDAQSSGDHVLAENYLQHAEHYNRIILVYREQQTQHAGEQPQSGGSRGFSQRHDSQDSDDAPADSAGAQQEEGATVERPYSARNGNGNGDGRHDFDQQPTFDDGRPMRREGQERRFGDRPSRQDRGEGFDRHRERPSYQTQPRDSDQPTVDAVRETRAPRPPREARERDDAQQVEGQAPSGEETPAPTRSGRGEGGPRRRERFSLSGADQPDFLRRPVRRSRREPDAGFTPDATPQADEGQHD